MYDIMEPGAFAGAAAASAAASRTRAPITCGGDEVEKTICGHFVNTAWSLGAHLAVVRIGVQQRKPLGGKLTQQRALV